MLQVISLHSYTMNPGIFNFYFLLFNLKTVNRYILLFVAISVVAASSSCSKRKVRYECQCYVNGTYTGSYPPGLSFGNSVDGRCYEPQHTYSQDTCRLSGSLH